MSIVGFVPGSELFRRKLATSIFNEGYDKFFITITLDNDVFRTFNVNEQFEQTISKIHNILSFFDQYYIVTEIQPNTNNLHYHITGLLNKFGGYITKYKQKFTDAPLDANLFYFVNRMIRSRIDTHGMYKLEKTIYGNETVRAIHSREPFTDVKVLNPTQDYISYLHKDIDHLYQMTKYDKVRFIIKAPVEELKKLHTLIDFKKR